MTQNTPLVSISLIAYNHANYIKKCIEGFLMQKTTFSFEILIHDDASTDGTDEIIKEYEKKYPNLIFPVYQKENQYSKGIMISPIFNWPRARGKYIALCEGDDYWTDPLKLQKQVDFLENNPDYVVTYHDARVIDHEGNIHKENFLSETLRKDFSEKELIQCAPLVTASRVYRNIIKTFPKELLKAPGGDAFLTSLLGAYGKGKYMDELGTASYYRVHEGGVVSQIPFYKQLNHYYYTRYWLTKYYTRINNIDTAIYFSEYLEHWLENKAVMTYKQGGFISVIKLYFYFLLKMPLTDFSNFCRINRSFWKASKNNEN
ncbi:MAG: glycosyltransferase family 2 protein [bacterium]